MTATPQDLAKLDAIISGKPEAITHPTAPERIYGWQHSQMSIARHYGGLRYMGHDYTISQTEEGAPLVRAHVLAREAKAAKAAAKLVRAANASKQGALL